MTAFWILICACGLCLTLWAEHRGFAKWVLVGKLGAASAYLGLAWFEGAMSTGWSRILFTGMLFCWLGDLLLVSRSHRAVFLAGLSAFLAGHLFYSVAFVSRGLSFEGMLAPAFGVLLFGVVVQRWLRPHLDRRMVLPVHAYLLAITIMWWLAMATHASRMELLLITGATLFVISDLAVARQRFVSPGIVNRLWGLPLYFGGQLCLALSVRSF